MIRLEWKLCLDIHSGTLGSGSNHHLKGTCYLVSVSYVHNFLLSWVVQYVVVLSVGHSLTTEHL